MMKILIFVGNPTQYHSPIFREMTKIPNLEVEVLYASDVGVHPVFNPEIDSILRWDIPLLEGFKFRFFKNLSSRESKGFFSRVNPTMGSYVYNSDADIVLIHGYDTFTSWIVYICSCLSSKRIFWRGETIGKGRNLGYKERIKGVVLRTYFKKVEKVFFSCNANKDYLRNFISSDDQFLDFPTSVDNKFFLSNKINDEEEIKEARSKLGISDSVVFGTVSRLTDRKRTIELLYSIKRLGISDASVLLIGGGPAKESILEAAKCLGIPTVVTNFVGQHEVAKYLSMIDVFFLLSKYDASPKALNEALNYEIPIVLSDGIGTAEDALLGLEGTIASNGLLVREENFYNDLDSAVLRLSRNSHEREEMGKMNTIVSRRLSIDTGINNLKEYLFEN